MNLKDKLLNTIDVIEGPNATLEALQLMFVEFSRCEIDWPREKRVEIANRFEQLCDLVNAAHNFAKEQSRNDFERKIGL